MVQVMDIPIAVMNKSVFSFLLKASLTVPMVGNLHMIYYFLLFRHGECVVNDKPKDEEYTAPGQWSDWSFSGCQSGCMPNVCLYFNFFLTFIKFLSFSL